MHYQQPDLLFLKRGRDLFFIGRMYFKVNFLQNGEGRKDNFMGIYVQLIQLAEETLVEVSGIREISGMYLENTDVDIFVECIENIGDKKIRLSIKPNDKSHFTSFFFDVQIIAHRIALAHLVNGCTVVIVPEGIDETLSDSQAIKESLQRNSGIWIDGLPKASISEIVKYCLC